jgi:hypothetical protein
LDYPIYTTLNFWYGTDKIGTRTIFFGSWTTYLGSNVLIRFRREQINFVGKSMASSYKKKRFRELEVLSTCSIQNVKKATPRSTMYKNRWAFRIFGEW